MSNKEEILSSIKTINEAISKLHPDTELGQEFNALYRKDGEVKDEWDKLIGVLIGGS